MYVFFVELYVILVLFYHFVISLSQFIFVDYSIYVMFSYFFFERSNHKAFSDIPIWMGETAFVLLVLVLFCYYRIST